jgi:hypothetical protein
MRQVDLAEVTHGDIEADQQDAVDGEQREQAQHVGIADRERDGGEDCQRSQLGATDEQQAFQHSRSVK